ncbi:MAG: hypothetical protein CMJ25_27165 [Phycisphaerae bacterium]|nr:hypothetical protein [Phycisphaerae bacterium]
MLGWSDFGIGEAAVALRLTVIETSAAVAGRVPRRTLFWGVVACGVGLFGWGGGLLEVLVVLGAWPGAVLARLGGCGSRGCVGGGRLVVCVGAAGFLGDGAGRGSGAWVPLGRWWICADWGGEKATGVARRGR